LKFLKDEDPVHKNISMQRWVRSWINKKKSINFSGLCREVIFELMKERDPEYYERYKHLLEENPTKQIEVIKKIISERNTH
jgi:hypothetical protein